MKHWYDRKSDNSDIKIRKYALSPLFDGPWTVRLGVNDQLIYNESGISKVMHQNKCKQVPQQIANYSDWDTYSFAKDMRNILM